LEINVPKTTEKANEPVNLDHQVGSKFRECPQAARRGNDERGTGAGRNAQRAAMKMAALDKKESNDAKLGRHARESRI